MKNRHYEIEKNYLAACTKDNATAWHQAEEKLILCEQLLDLSESYDGIDAYDYWINKLEDTFEEILAR